MTSRSNIYLFIFFVMAEIELEVQIKHRPLEHLFAFFVDNKG